MGTSTDRETTLRPAPDILFQYLPDAARDQYLQVGNVRTRYRAAGSEEPALILIHGLGSSLECWSRNLEPLARAHRVYAPDVVWFGKTDKPRGQVTGDAFVRFVTRFMDSVGLRRAVLVGSSMGGMIAARTALQCPDRISGLVLVAAAGFGRELWWWLRLLTLLKWRSPVRVSRWAARLAAGVIAYDWRTIGDEFIDLTVEMGMTPGALEAHDRVLRFGVDWRGVKPMILREVRDKAHQIRVPTLIVWGKQDRLIPVAHAAVAQHRIPNSRVHIFDRCGHAPMLEKPDEFNTLVSAFVRENIRA